jgi:hypothetical protein
MPKLGNPALVAAAASNPDLVKGATKIIVGTQEKAVQTVKIGVGLVAAVATGWYVNKKFKEIRKQNFVNKNAHLPDVQVAMIMRKAMFRVEFNSFPFNLISIPDGTNESLLYSLAKKVSSLEAVLKAYSILFESNLALDVYGELSDKELIKFYESLGSKAGYTSQFNANGSPKPQTPLSIGVEVVVSNPKGTTIYKTKEQNGRLVQVNETLEFVKFGEIVGKITGRFVGTSGAYYYTIDMDDFKYSPDWFPWRSNGWVAHTEIKQKD